MSTEVNKYIYRKVAIANSYILEELPDGSKKIIFQPIIYISCKNQKDLTIIDFDLTESIIDNVSSPAVNNSNNPIDSLVSVKPNLLNHDSDIVTESLPGILEDLEHRDLIKSTTANHSENLKVQTVDQNVLEPIIEIIETSSDSKLSMLKSQVESRQTRSCKCNISCSKCQNFSTSVMDDKCSNCLYPLPFKCTKCLQLFESQAMVESHAMKCEIKNKLFFENASKKVSCDDSTLKLLRRHIQKRPPTKNQKKSFEGKQCKSSFQGNRRLPKQKAIIGKQGNTKVQCPYCSFSNAKKAVISHHISKSHQEYMPDDFKCSRCGRKYCSFDSLKTHINKSKCTKRTLYTCNHCNLQTYNKTILGNHLKKNHAHNLKQKVSAKMKM